MAPEPLLGTGLTEEFASLKVNDNGPCSPVKEAPAEAPQEPTAPSCSSLPLNPQPASLAIHEPCPANINADLTTPANATAAQPMPEHPGSQVAMSATRSAEDANQEAETPAQETDPPQQGTQVEAKPAALDSVLNFQAGVGLHHVATDCQAYLHALATLLTSANRF